MSIIKCSLTDCEYNKDCYCEKDYVFMDCGQCDDYSDITEGKEYQEVYYKACKRSDKNDIPDEYYRVKSKGKRVDYRGYSFYTNSDIRGGLEGAVFTEGRSGYAVSLYSLKTFEEAFQKFESKVKEVKDVMTLPLYKWDGDQLVKDDDEAPRGEQETKEGR